jgi:ribosome-binding protein aMBF1 (putative translation factor)
VEWGTLHQCFGFAKGWAILVEIRRYFTSVDVKSSSLEPYAVSRKNSPLQARDVLARNIRSLRAKREISQEELADLAGLHRTYVGSIERSERNVSIDNIAKIADALGVKMYELLKDPTAS